MDGLRAGYRLAIFARRFEAPKPGSLKGSLSQISVEPLVRLLHRGSRGDAPALIDTHAHVDRYRPRDARTDAGGNHRRGPVNRPGFGSMDDVRRFRLWRWFGSGRCRGACILLQPERLGRDTARTVDNFKTEGDVASSRLIVVNARGEIARRQVDSGLIVAFTHEKLHITRVMQGGCVRIP